MKIQQAEELAGISKKNIRFYEKEGLLNVTRADNGYREYSLEDVERLKLIKLLRKLDFSIENIRDICEQKVSLKSCMDLQTEILRRRSRDYIKMSSFCEQIAQAGNALDTFSPDVWLEQIERCEQEGMTFMDVKTTDIHRKKTLGAVGAAAVMIIFFGLMICLVVWANNEDPAPAGVLWGTIGVFCIVILGIVVAVVGRMKEIKGGEEDEGSKY